MQTDVIAALVATALSCAVGLAALGWAIGRRAWPVGAGIAVLLTCGAATVAAGRPEVPAALVVPLLALAPLQVIGLVLVLGGWRPGDSTAGAVAVLALASSAWVALGYSTFGDPRCVARCDALEQPVLGGAVVVAATTSAALLGCAALLTLVSTARSPAPLPVRLGVVIAAVGIATVALTRGAGWGVGPRLVGDLGWQVLPAAAAGMGVLVAALRTRMARRGLAEAARRLEVLARAAPPPSAGDLPTQAPVDTSASSLVDEILRDNLRAASALASRRLEIRASQGRVVAAADRERRRIEHDLHDGTQQRLVAALFCLALAEGRATSDERTVLRGAVEEVQVVLEGLRAVGQAVFPRLLESDGLVAALRGLAANAEVPIGLVVHDEVPDASSAATMSAYACVRALTIPGAGPLEVTVGGHEDLRLRVVTALTVERAASITDLSVRDRVGAVGGWLDVGPAGTGSVVEAVIPCGS